MSLPMSPATHPPSVRRGFTLVELLVVIGIMAVLAALVTPAVMGVRRSARIAAIKTEIDLIQLAFENYKAKYGDLPPCFSGVSCHSGDQEGVLHLARIFPRAPSLGTLYANQVAQAQLLGYMNIGPDVAFPALGEAPTSLPIRPDNAIAIWLRGYTSDPRRPVLATTGSVTLVAGTWEGLYDLRSGTVTVSGSILPRMKVFDFDEARITSITAANPLQYYPPGLPQSPYHYIDAANYSLDLATLQMSLTGTLAYFGTNPTQLSVVGAQCVPRRPLPAKPSPTTPDAWYFTAAASGTTFFNPDSFQILCAGLDGVFGTDDDLSNFWKGTRREYLDSLRTQ